MYNRYIPEYTSYTRVEPEREENPGHRAGTGSRGPGRRPEEPAQQTGRSGPASQAPSGGGGFRLPPFLTGKNGLSGLLKALHLDNVDTGDVLLLLIILYLLVEGDDLELVIALGLVLIMGLGEDWARPEE